MACYAHCMLAMSLFFAVVTGTAAWDSATATFYGDEQGRGTLEGACGYEDLIKQGYGLETTALSPALYNDGLTCGACFEVQCYNSKWCHPGSILITATNLCPNDPSKPPTAGGWCNPPNKHFDLTEPMYLKIAEYKAGIVPVQYRRVPCSKTGGVKFEFGGNPYFLLVLVYNVGGAGDVNAVAVKGSGTNWIPMSRNWGQKWQTGTKLTGQSLSFRVTTSDGKMVQSDNVSPANWQFGQTYEGKQF